MKKFLIFTLFISPYISSGQTSSGNQKTELEKLNEYLFSEYILKHNTEPIDEIANEDFILIAAIGIVEDKNQIITGVNNLNISSLKITVDKIIETENVGIVIGVLEMQGTVMNRPIPGKIRFSNTFLRQDGEWKLQLRTMTPINVKQ